MRTRNRQARFGIWKKIRKLKRFTIADLVAVSTSRSVAQRFVLDLQEAGYVSVVEERVNGRSGGSVFELVQDPGEILPNFDRFEEGRSKAWTTMRVMTTFCVRELVSTTDEAISENNAKKFVRRLEQAGYVRLQTPKRNGEAGSWNVYRLVRNSGPQAPIPKRDGTVFDPNLNQIFGAQE